MNTTTQNGKPDSAKRRFYSDPAVKPSVLPVNPAGIPAELKARPQWVAWRLEWKNDKWGKPPINPRTGGYAKSNDPTTWATFEEALAFYQSGKADGIGYVFSEDDPYCGADFDDALDDQKELLSWAAPLITDLDTYTDFSPSHTGVKAFFKGKLPDGCDHNGSIGTGHVELYDRARYFCVTGHAATNAYPSAPDRQAQLDALLVRIGLVRPNRHETRDRASSAPGDEAARLADALQHVPGADGYERWLQVGMALHSWDAINGYALWCDWSSTSSKYTEEACRQKWATFKPGGGLTIATVYRLALDNGWQYPPGTGPSFKAAGSHNGQTAASSASSKMPAPDDSAGSSTTTAAKPPREIHLTDTGNAYRFARMHRGVALHCSTWKKWLEYDGTRWREDETCTADRMAKAVVRELFHEAQWRLERLSAELESLGDETDDCDPSTAQDVHGGRPEAPEMGTQE